MNYIIIDSGTSATKAFLFNSDGVVLHSQKIKHALFRPQQYHVESDALVILETCKSLFEKMVIASGDTPVHSSGLAIQRSTFLFWE